MSQYPHDEFDDVPPYQSGEAGKHRAPAAAQTGTGGRGGLRWIGLLAVVALLIGVASWFVLPDLIDDSGPEATDEDAETAEEQGEAADDEEGDEEDGNGTDEEEDDAGNGEDDEASEQVAADQSAPVQVLNYQGPGGLENEVQDELETMGYNVTYVDEWAWGEVETPVIYYPAEAEDHAQDVAENLGIDNVVEDGANWGYVAVVVGPEDAD